MASNGGTGSDGHDKSAYRGFVVAFAVMAFVGVLALGTSGVQRIQSEKLEAQQATNRCTADPAQKSCEGAIALRSAIASEHAVRVGIWQAVFNFFGLAGLAGTVVFAGMAWRATQKGAAAAEKSAEIASDTAKKQLRAYVIISGARIHHMGNSRKRTLVISSNNYGVTPATDLEIWRQVVFRRFPFKEDFDHTHPPHLHKARDIIGPGQKQSSRIRIRTVFNQRRIRDIVRERGGYYVYGNIRYRDIFGDEHVTNFRFRTYDRTGAMVADDRGNDMT